MRVGNYDLSPDQWGKPFPIEPGTAEVTLDTPGRARIRQSLTLVPGDRRDVLLDGAVAGPVMGPAEPVVVASTSKTNGLRIGGIIVAGVGLVGFGMFAGGGAASSSTYSALKTKCGGDSGGCKGQNVDGDISSGRTQQAIANAGLILGIVGVAAGTTMIVLSTRKKSDPGPRTGLVVGPAYAGLSGTF